MNMQAPPKIPKTPRPPSIPPPLPRQYQCRIEACAPYEIAALGNELGNIGWELVGCLADLRDPERVWCIFKKEKLPR